MTIILGWLPGIDLPFPLVMVGGLLLAIASNRADAIRASGAKSSSPTIKANTSSPQMSQVETLDQARPGSPNHEDVLIQSEPSSPSLPNWTVKSTGLSGQSAYRPISPTISKEKHPISSISPDHGDLAKDVPESADPQLPTFMEPPPPKKDRVSFTIDNQN